ncbi:MAG TPA: histidine kinase [Rhodocyclaceae bacterium]|nr:histidine kinase [Rhodocyclaceae bacterium]
MTKMSLSKLLRELALALGYNTAVCVFLTVVTPYSLATNLVFTQFIGLSIYATVRGSGVLLGLPRPGLVSAAIGIPLGGLIGFTLATWAKGLTLAEVLLAHPDVVPMTAATVVIFGALAVWHFHDEARMLEAQAEARAERVQRVEREAANARTELALLQAQIEPHFLFNTLSNVVGLIDTRPEAARTMLLDLTALLRTSLARTRRATVTLGEELDLLRAYLGIMAVRMGGRLDWHIDAAPDVLGAHLLPLLVQPLVENAIRHGLEPKAANGRLTIRCWRQGDTLHVEVNDNGLGFGDEIREGTGLANVRQRLATLCGADAALSLASNSDGGVSAEIRLPFANHGPAPADC